MFRKSSSGIYSWQPTLFLYYTHLHTVENSRHMQVVVYLYFQTLESEDEAGVSTFSGSFIHTVDEKSRVAMPARFRDMLDGKFMLTKGPDGCLWAIPIEQWRIILSRASTSVVIQRFFLASACECEINIKGRFLIPDTLRQHADIKPQDDVVIVGIGNRIEIWSRRRWEAVSSQLTSERLRQELPEFFQF